VFFFKPLREKLLKEKGIELVVDEVWTPPLADATSIVQKLRNTQPDLVFYGATNFPDSSGAPEVKEFGLKTISRGWARGWSRGVRDYVGKELLESIQSVVASQSAQGSGRAGEEVPSCSGRASLSCPDRSARTRMSAHQGGSRAGEVGRSKAIRDALARST